MNKLALIAAAALSATTFGLAAMAQDQADDSFDRADGNKDAVVSFDEARGIYPTLSQTIFDMADANADGTLDEGEYGQLKGLTAGFPTATTSSESSSEVSSEESSESSSEDSSSSSAQ